MSGRPRYEELVRLARHSDWHPLDRKRELQDTIYAKPAAWQRFATYLLLGAGAAFLLSGVVFFFAYNWAALPRLTKLGIVGGLLLLTGFAALFAPVRLSLRRVLLTATVVLIGVLLAVLGQVYQTGANSYQLFLAWSVFAIPWVVLVPFAPLYLLMVVLLNTTFLTYTQQTGAEWNYLASGNLLFVLNVVCWLVLYLLDRQTAAHEWLTRLVALWAAIVISLNMVNGSLGEQPLQLLLAFGLAGLVFAGWTRLAFRERSIYYLTVVGGAAILTVTFLALQHIGGGTGSLFLCGAFLVGSVSLLAKRLQVLNVRWRD